MEEKNSTATKFAEYKASKEKGYRVSTKSRLNDCKLHYSLLVFSIYNDLLCSVLSSSRVARSLRVRLQHLPVPHRIAVTAAHEIPTIGRLVMVPYFLHGLLWVFRTTLGIIVTLLSVVSGAAVSKPLLSLV